MCQLRDSDNGLHGIADAPVRQQLVLQYHLIDPSEVPSMPYPVQ
jgi:hypothetical protein